MKLIIYDSGDHSVGINSATWEIDVPFTKEDADDENLEWFRNHMIEAYKEYCEGRMYALYDFEYPQTDF